MSSQKSPKLRLDALLAEQLGVSRAKAAALVMAGSVKIDGRQIDKPGHQVRRDVHPEVADTPRAVSRAGAKLAGALDRWDVVVNGEICLDVGASTGGFTEVLLERGARRVFAVDTGRGQLDWKLRQDSRVESMERTDIRKVASLPETIGIAVIDVSFISLRLVLPAVQRLAPAAAVVALFKPQFEVGKSLADQGRGVIKDQDVVESALHDFMRWAESSGWHCRRTMAASIRGTKGNQEWLVWLAPIG